MADILATADQETDLVRMTSILREAGHTVRVARRAGSALRAAQIIVPDLVILDVILPDQDGFTTCKQIHATPALANVPVMFVSGLNAIGLKAQAFEAGAGDFIVSPYHPRELVARSQHQIELAKLRDRIAENARLDERQHIARELHDSVSQSMFVLSASIETLLLTDSTLTTETKAKIERLLHLSQSATAEMRTLLFELRPRQFTELPIHRLLMQLIESVRGRSRADLVLVADECPAPPDVKLVIYRVAQEALNNAAKHAHAQQVSIQLSAQPNGGCRLTVQDDGQGFEMGAAREGIGLRVMRERAEAVGMRLDVFSALGMGTRISLTWAGSGESTV